jgi:hypothetical protein
MSHINHKQTFVDNIDLKELLAVERAKNNNLCAEVEQLRARAEADEADAERLAEALDYLVQVVDASMYGQTGLHTWSCPYPDYSRCTCDANAAMDMARDALAAHAKGRPDGA